MMVSPRLFVFLACLSFLASGGALHAQTPLKYQFKKGEVLKYVMVVGQKGTTKAKDMESTLMQTQTIDLSWHVQSVDDKGAAKIRVTFDRAKLSVSNGKDNFEGVSDVKEDPESEPAKSMTTLAKTLAKVEATFTMSPQGDISDVSIPASVIKEIKAIGGEKAADGWTEDNLKATLRDNTLALPKEPAGKGLTWKRSIQLKSPYGPITGSLEYAWDGVVMRDGVKVTRLAVNPKLKLEPDPNAKPPVTIKSYDVEGTALFDNNAGRIFEISVSQKIEAQAEVGGMTVTDRREMTNSFKFVSAK